MTYGNIKQFPLASDVAAEAAHSAVATLGDAIARHGRAVWVLAGGSSPMAAYRILGTDYVSSVDWSKVTVLIGDERSVPVDHPDSNWGQIAPALFDNPAFTEMEQLRPASELDAEEAARLYANVVAALPTTASGAPRLDLVWLGVGEDGHTLSLFPGHPDFRPVEELVIPVYDSPKPPPTRITLTLKALDGAQNTVIFATGAGKRDSLTAALSEGALPIAVVAAHVVANGGSVDWLFDEAASSR